MLKRVIAVAIATIGLMAAPAAAQQYPPAENGLSVDDTCPAPGEDVTLTASTFAPGEEVAFSFGPDVQSLGSAVADSAGSATLTVAIPDGTDGTLVVKAVGTSVTVTGELTVAADGCAPGDVADVPAPAGGDLPNTGSGLTMPLLQIGLGLAALGGLLLAASAKRRRSSASASV